jgi:hypothetical protein
MCYHKNIQSVRTYHFIETIVDFGGRLMDGAHDNDTLFLGYTHDLLHNVLRRSCKVREERRRVSGRDIWGASVRLLVEGLTRI